ncbi:uracil-DNA glycosylase family protein [Erythrobacter sp. R86502]|uniref:uracil-DNA glycosylase family protein n=1 Tax=Erythrobacter sp. R86502 TaxID=3093846 RepID=UPI0036D31C35
MSRPEPSLVHEFEAALAWWQAAGVDHDYSDDATAWLAPEPGAQASDTPGNGASARNKTRAGGAGLAVAKDRTAAPSSPSATLRRDLLGESPPQDLAAFREWWMTAPGIDTARAYPRILPRGDTQPALMVLVPQPEDTDHETLLSGAQGRLLTNMLAAMGLDDSAVYIGAALPCHTPMADLATLAASGMDAVTAHHISLVRPARVLVLGTGLAPMLGGTPEEPLREINQAGGKVPVMSSETLDALMEMPRLKARFWRRWIEWWPSQ